MQCIVRDITVRRQSESVLRELRRAVDQSIDGICISDATEKVRFCNVAWGQLHGCSEAETSSLAGKELAAFHTPEQFENEVRPMLAELREAGSYQGEVNHMKQTGVTFPTWMSVSTLKDEEGVTVGFLGVARDLTARHEAEQKLQRIEAELQRITASVSDYLWSANVDPAGRLTYLYYSPVVERITGRPPEFFMKGRESWASTIHPDDRNRLLASATAMMTGESIHSEEEYRVVRPDGKNVWVRDSVNATGLGDGSIRLNGVVSDISERKRVEHDKDRVEAELRQAQKLEAVGVLASGIAHDFNNILASIMLFSDLAKEQLPEGSQASLALDEVLRSGERARDLVQQMLAFSRKGDPRRKPVDIAELVQEALQLIRASLPSTVNS